MTTQLHQIQADRRAARRRRAIARTLTAAGLIGLLCTCAWHPLATIANAALFAALLDSVAGVEQSTARLLAALDESERIARGGA